MKMLKFSSKIKLFFLALFLSSAPLIVTAQIDFGTDTDGTGVTDTPVDGGVVFLLVAGTALGAMKLYKMKSKSNTGKAII